MPFSNVPLEPDTTILEQVRVHLDGYDVLYQRWSWGGMKGETLIFREDQVEGFTDKQLHRMAREKGLIPEAAAITIGRQRQGYAFLNYFASP